MSTEKEYLALYSTKCLRCSHLVEGAPQTFNKCHFKLGRNKQCPASEVGIVIVGKAMSYANKVLKARENRDTALESRLFALVAKESEAFKTKFYDYLEKSR